MIKHRDEGFTFVETLAVLAIAVILTATAGLSVLKYIEQAKRTAAATQIETYKAALHVYFLDCGTFPTELQGLGALWEKPRISPVPSSWNGPYIDRQIRADPWGIPYEYRTDASNGLPFVIMSYGDDRKEGGEGSNADIVSWK
jgi:general secretion pathway protein G